MILLYQKKKSFLFPPIIKKFQLSFDYASPVIQDTWTKYGRKQNYTADTLIQCYHAENILLLSPLVK